MSKQHSVLINFTNRVIAVFMALLLVACGGGGSSSGGSGTLSLGITDAPVMDNDIAAVWVRVTGVIVHSDAGDDTPQAVTDGTNPWIDVNLKDLTKGKTMLLGEFDLPAGHYSWIRLVIDPDNTLIVERTVVGEPDEVDNSQLDTLYPPKKLDCSSCDESHLKLIKSFTIENSGWQNFTIDFNLQKSLTLQLPQSQIPRPDYAYKLRPTLRILDAELASTYIWGSVTDTNLSGDPSACKVYTYEGDMNTVDPIDDICDDSCMQSPIVGTRPLDIALVEGPAEGPFTYRTGSLYPNTTYTVALFCTSGVDNSINVDDPGNDDSLDYVGEQEVTTGEPSPSGFGSVDFDLSDPGGTTP